MTGIDSKFIYSENTQIFWLILSCTCFICVEIVMDEGEWGGFKNSPILSQAYA